MWCTSSDTGPASCKDSPRPSHRAAPEEYQARIKVVRQYFPPMLRCAGPLPAVNFCSDHGPSPPQFNHPRFWQLLPLWSARLGTGASARGPRAIVPGAA